MRQLMAMTVMITMVKASVSAQAPDRKAALDPNSYGELRWANTLTPLPQTAAPTVHPVSPVRRPAVSLQTGVRTTQIGATTYDLQTNGAMAQRMLVWPNGSPRIAATWTMSLQLSGGFPDRGTGYNYYNGNQWGADPSTRIANYRNGWPTMGTYSHNGTTYEYIFSHMLDPGSGYYGGFFFSSRQQGMGNWTVNEVFHHAQMNHDTFLWASTASSGDYIYLLCNNRRANSKANGVRRPVLFSRYQISTQKWIDSMITLPGYDSTQYYSGGGDEYNIDARDSIVAVVIGGIGTHLTLWKSTDYGTTWTKKFVDRFPVDAYGGNAVIPDTPGTNDGSVSVLIDHTGKVHVAWALTFITDPDSTDNSYFFFPGARGILYWNEDMPEDSTGDIDSAIFIATIYDRGGDGQLFLNGATFSSGRNGGARYSNASACSHVNLAIDSSGNLFAVYDCVVDSIFDLATGLNLRDVFVVYSTDGGWTWSWPPANISADNFAEDVFGFVARRLSSDSLHLIYQSDAEAGPAVQQSHSVTLNSIIHASVSISDLLAGKIPPDAPETGGGSGIQGVVATDPIGIAPNPVTSQATILLPIDAPMGGILTIYTSQGQAIYQRQVNSRRMQVSLRQWKAGTYLVAYQTQHATYRGRLNVR